MGRFAAAVCLAMGMLALCNGQIPTFEECDATFDRLGEDSLQSTFTPCALGNTPSASCCSAISSTTGISGGGELAGCLCQQQVIDGFVGVLEQNSLASAVGFDGAKLMSVLSACGADFVGNNGCVSASTPAEPTPETSTEQTPDTSTTTQTQGTSPTPTPSPSPPSLKPPATQTQPQATTTSGKEVVVTGPDGVQYVIQNAEPGVEYKIVLEPATVAASTHPLSGLAAKIPLVQTVLTKFGRR